ncbi:MAG: dihydroorotate dehydrogenase electron transfer subunit, partial [Ignavibacteriae bacterium]|nr:dihydroorotate dehydrogenase electron transfer subunit [Ignavibacteriota bacterium]
LLTQQLNEKKTITTFLGARTKEQLIPSFLTNIQTATDDGSHGFKGTVVSLLDEYLKTHQVRKPKIFACGPNIMLNALSELAQRWNIPCEVSLETTMACGIGICQGCPVERVEQKKKYSLCCKDGPVFDVQTVKFSHAQH